MALATGPAVDGVFGRVLFLLLAAGGSVAGFCCRLFCLFCLFAAFVVCLLFVGFCVQKTKGGAVVVSMLVMVCNLCHFRDFGSYSALDQFVCATALRMSSMHFLRFQRL